jgi:hypothetical protein
MTRFQMKIDPAWRPLVLVGGATRRNSYVDVTPEAVTWHFGYAFNHTEDRDDITEVKSRGWPWWMGVGWRTNLRGLVGLIGSYDNIVEVAFEGQSRAWGFFPLNRIAVSLEDPEGFMSALQEKPAVATAPAHKPARRATRTPRRRTRGNGSG